MIRSIHIFAGFIGILCLLIILFVDYESWLRFPFEPSSRGDSVAVSLIDAKEKQALRDDILRGISSESVSSRNGAKEASVGRGGTSLSYTPSWRERRNREWYTALTRDRYQSLCGRDGMSAVIEELRGRSENTHQTLVWVASGGGLGNQLDTVLASLIGALMMNRTIQIYYTFPVLDYFEPTTAFSKWKFLDVYDPEQNFYLGSSKMPALRLKFNKLLVGEYSNAQDVILYDVPTGDPSSNDMINKELSRYLRDKDVGCSAIEAMQCLSREFLRPRPVVMNKLREVLTSFNGRVSIGIHLRKSDSSMATYMKVQTRRNARRRLSLDLSGDHFHRNGCTDDFTFRGCLLKHHDEFVNLMYPLSVVYYVAADAVASYGVVKEVMAHRNTTVFWSNGVPTHTGRHWHSAQSSLQNSGDANSTDGNLKAVLDFFTLIHVDHYIANCPLGGSTFSWNIHNARLGAPSIHGEDRLCGAVRDVHDEAYSMIGVHVTIALIIIVFVFAVRIYKRP